MSDQPKPPGAWLFDIAAGLSLLTALIFATGWTYAFHYFDRFGLGLLGLDIPHEYVLMYGFWVFKAWWWLVIGYYLFALVLLLGLHRRSRRAGRTGVLARQTQIVLVLLAFVVSGWLARQQAADYHAEQQARGFAAYPYVRVWPKGGDKVDLSLQPLYTALPRGDYRLLLQGKERLYLIKPPRDGLPARLAVTEITLEEVQMLRITP